MTFCEKISKILTYNTLGVSSPSGLEEHLHIGRRSISGHCSKKQQKIDPESAPGLKTQKIIVEKLRINQTWWDSGEGDMFLEEPTNKKSNLKDVDIIESENYVGMHRRVYDTLEKNMDTHRKLMLEMSETIKNLTGNQGGSPGGKQVSLPQG